jgi:hypothetical protein
MSEKRYRELKNEDSFPLSLLNPMHRAFPEGLFARRESPVMVFEK